MVDLSRHLLKGFADISSGDSGPEVSKTVRGTVVVEGGQKYVEIDGSSVRTPMSEVIDARAGDRVLVNIEHHVATVVGNISKPPSAYKEEEAITGINTARTDFSNSIERVKSDTTSKVGQLIETNNRSVASAIESAKTDLKGKIDSAVTESNKKILAVSSTVNAAKTDTATKLAALNKTITDSVSTTNNNFGSFKTTVNEAMRVMEQKIKNGSNSADVEELKKKMTKANETIEKNKEIQAAQAKALMDQLIVTRQDLEARAALATAKEFDEKYKAFLKANEAGRKQAEQDLITMAARMEKVQANIENMTAVWNAIDSTMKFSNEGLAIGERSGDSYIMVKPNRISMYSAGSEVMYISNGVIHIDNGVFTLSLQVGYYVESQYPANNKYNVIRYVGPR